MEPVSLTSLTWEMLGEMRENQQTSRLSRDVKLQRKLDAPQAINQDLFDDNARLFCSLSSANRRVKRLKRKNTILSWTLFILVLGFFMLAGLWDIWSWGILIGIVLGVVVIWFGSEA